MDTLTYTLDQHQAEHDSVVDPKPGCPFCEREVFRRTHKCFGEGFSNQPHTPSLSGRGSDGN